MEDKNNKEEKAGCIERITRNAFHKLNNHLFVISGRLELLLEQENLSGEIREELNIISTKIENIKKLINETTESLKNTA